MKKRLLALTTAVVMTMSLAGCGSSNTTSIEESNSTIDSSSKAVSSDDSDADLSSLKLAFIVGTKNDVFYQTVESGIEDQCNSYGIQDITFGDQELDASKCTDLINTYVAGGYNGIALSCNDKAGVVPAFESANAEGVPMFTFDCTLDGQYSDQYLAFVGTNNYAGGQVAGQYILDNVEDDDIVVCITYASAQSTIDRQTGFEDTVQAAIDNGSAKIMLAPSQDANNDQSKAADIMQDLITKYGEQLKYVFVVGDPTGFGALSSIQSMGSTTKIVGFDASETACNYIADKDNTGKIWVADVAQDPHSIGAGIVDKMVEYYKTGEVAEKNNELSPTLVTAENVSEYLK